ncbi:MAG: alpha/beta fold hydrolase [Comamonadaceae bacterium]|nr:MAG: alpha/beta fold hydrolase [Comamonadaceae bacterium]
MAQRLSWERDGQDWPHRDRSTFVQAAGLQWHVQRFDAAVPGAPLAVLIHGTGASTHSWRDVAPRLAARGLSALAFDLPGHAFTGMPAGGTGSGQFTLPGMAAAIAALLQELGAVPALLVGHSAGAALALRLALDGGVRPQAIAGFNAALLPWRGLPGQFFSPVARLMAAGPLVPRLFAWRAADPAVVRRLLAGTGSILDAPGQALYARLVSNPGHAQGALAMMAGWDLAALERDLPAVRTPLHLLVGSQDRTVPPSQAPRVLHQLDPRVPQSLTVLQGLGHLAHEEAPQQAIDHLLQQVEPGLSD